MESSLSSVPTEVPSHHHHHSSGNVVSVLSIDGGGVRGLIPAVFLRHLEKDLQECAGDPNVRIADYFDVIAGTSTGGLIAALLTAPDPNNQTRPLFAASEIVELYETKSPEIFPQGCRRWRMKINAILRYITKTVGRFVDQIRAKIITPTINPGILKPLIKAETHDLVFPSYDVNPFGEILEHELGNSCLHDSLTHVVIPTFDMKQVAPTIFSTNKIKEVPALNAKLSDICLGTSAVPIYFPPLYFVNHKHEFHLIDGGVSALNPGLAVISELTQHKMANPNILPMINNPNDYKKFLMISLGCGTQPKKYAYDARNSFWWGLLHWISAIIEFLQCGSQDMVDYHLATVFRAAGQAEEHYLRIQDDGLTEEMVPMDNSSKENLDNLEKYAKELLNKPVKRMNTQTFEFEPVPERGTNAEALRRMAKILHEEKQDRLHGN